MIIASSVPILCPEGERCTLPVNSDIRGSEIDSHNTTNLNKLIELQLFQRPVRVIKLIHPIDELLALKKAEAESKNLHPRQ